jgi:hypothetical protein
MSINFMELFDDIQLPATRAELVEHAAEKKASEDALDMLQAMPDEQFYTLEDINKNVSQFRQVPGGDSNLYSSSQKS